MPAADIRSFAFALLSTSLFAAAWLSASLWLLPFLALLCFCLCLAKHNHVHRPVFDGHLANRAWSFGLAILTGSSCEGIREPHNSRHHHQPGSPLDAVRPQLAGQGPALWRLLRFTVASLIESWRLRQPASSWENRELLAVLLVAIAALFYDPRKALLFLLLPWIIGQLLLLAVNLPQHEGLPAGNGPGHSRDMCGRLSNWFLFNAGYHSAHHAFPGAHWSELPRLHAEHIAPFAPAAIQHNSLGSWALGWSRHQGKTRPDPRRPFLFLLASYTALGCLYLGFNRSPQQILLMIGLCAGLDFLLKWCVHGRREIPLSGLITGCGLSILLNYPHDLWLPLFPALLAIGSKYVFTWQGRHVFNPGLFGVIAALFLGQGLYASAPAYQWGIGPLASVAVISLALLFFIRQAGRLPLVLAFLVSYLLCTLLRAWIMRHHLPPEVILFGSLSSPALFLFAFYMISDPATSPSAPRHQILWGIAIALLDLAYHLKSSLATQFLALFFLAATFWAGRHLVRLVRSPQAAWRAAQKAAPRLAVASIAFWALMLLRPAAAPLADPGFKLEAVAPSQSGLHAQLGTVLTEVDPRVAHIAKWVLSIGSSAACADIDGDGDQDLFLVQPLMRPEDRCQLLRNDGHFHFTRLPLPALDAWMRDPHNQGIPAGALFCDTRNSGRPDLLVLGAFGRCHLLLNQFPDFIDAPSQPLTQAHCVSVGACAADFDRDGLPDLFIANGLQTHLPDYAQPTPFNIFQLPQPEFPGDRRMFHFLHQGWHNSNNGGLNLLYHNTGPSGFATVPAAQSGLDQTRWTLAAAAADLNGDGRPDLYCANDFGPDDCLLQDPQGRFLAQRGSWTGSIGRDTYKGMNASIGDLDNDGQPMIYVSNVHAPLQAEGSLLWKISPDGTSFRDVAAARGCLNEKAFGWGAAFGDLDLDGRLDLAQANGMVDDTPDKKFAVAPSYWYKAGQIMRSGPDIHSYADSWPDLRGYEIWGRQANRLYLNRGPSAQPQFADAAAALGIDAKDNSRSMIFVDFDNDGDLDLLVTHQFRAPDLYRNPLQETQPRAWLGLQLVGDGHRATREGLGAKVILHNLGGDGPPLQSREVQSNSGFSAQGERRLLFGLGLHPGKISLEILWPDGSRQMVEEPKLNGYLRVEQR